MSVHNAGVFAVAAIMLSVAQKQQTWVWVPTELKVTTTLPAVQSQYCAYVTQPDTSIALVLALRQIPNVPVT